MNRKGAGIFIRAAAIVEEWRRSVPRADAALVPPICWLVVGDGDLRTFLERAATPDVHFSGFVPHRAMRELLLAAPGVDLLVFPSLFPEALGMSAVEALGLGIPVVTSGIGGATEFVEHMRSGVVVPRTLPPCPAALRADADAGPYAGADADAGASATTDRLLAFPLRARRFACAIVGLALNATMRAEFGARGQALVATHLSVAQQTRRWRQLYDDEDAGVV